MVETRLQLKDYSGAMRDIETVLLSYPQDTHFNLLKVKTALLWLGPEVTHQ